MRRLGFVRFSVSVASLAVLVAAMHIPAPAQTGVNVTTWHNDNWRSGQNTNETILTPSNLGSANFNFGQLCSVQLDGQVYAQPLVVRGECSEALTATIFVLDSGPDRTTIRPLQWMGGSLAIDGPRG